MAESDIYDLASEAILKEPAFRQAYEELLKSQYLGTRTQVSLTLPQLKHLLKAASIFAFGNKDELKQIAYKIAAIISENCSTQYDQINKITQYIMISSGQLPVIKKNISDGNTDYFSTYKESEIFFNPLLFKNVIEKQALNKLPLVFDGEPVFLTDFQSKTFKDLVNGKSISLSAPTSSGKSFLLIAYLAKKFSDQNKLMVVYIVPTRALISQVQRDFKAGFVKFGVSGVAISSSTASQSKTKIIPKKLFVLTQERFHNLLFDADFSENINVLIIDEAQKVADISRGILLEEVIDEAIKRNSEMQKIFLSPFIKNPEKFAKMFHLDALQTEKTKVAPVSQNILRLNITADKYHINLSTAEFENEIRITDGTVDNNGIAKDTSHWQLLWAAKKFSGNYNIAYCNSPRMCVPAALSFAATLPEQNDPDIEEFINFLKEQIHADYFLIECLRKGVAYHYGKMPTQIRSIVENLFKNKKLKYVFCTSTLLEGVNLPAQNIFIYKPRQGREPMNRLNFWNLAGRAGRLLQDYYGNIFCINVEDWTGYKPDPRDVEQEIESILESTVINKYKEIMNYLKGVYLKLKGKDKPIEQAVTRFIIQQLKHGETSFVQNLTKRNELVQGNLLQAIETEIKEIAGKIELPPDIIQKNSSINPLKQQALLDYFKKNDAILPIHPTQKDFLKNLTDIFKLINEIFLDLAPTKKSYIYHALLAAYWIWGKSIPELVKFKLYRISQNQTPTTEMINKAIDDLFGDLNDKIRFDYQKFLKCYTDILLHYFKQENYDSTKICDSLSMYLEYGTYKKNVLILQSLGMSRSTALTVGAIAKEKFADEADCSNWIKLNFANIKRHLPAILFKELSDASY